MLRINIRKILFIINETKNTFQTLNKDSVDKFQCSKEDSTSYSTVQDNKSQEATTENNLINKKGN